MIGAAKRISLHFGRVDYQKKTTGKQPPPAAANHMNVLLKFESLPKEKERKQKKDLRLRQTILSANQSEIEAFIF